mmetsp:Transcript_38279/g.46732  ORF Transcript_38279/g.46732 Transcript_38279/m.46732 type:complete len:189 (-) Transcript_38279:99-665(-)|eukprot:CAMPEP_0172496252 /NCGR_PEP_ID=MMETSP1066-20121228/84080_1 /TAXON_ID=671091 /ORGANISM="Coscinodiscus wailesii, Strain CCMP2513" /LENGTH=188 /DNA_ID=CAMNT_0013268445 /DNA_START=94 /DNA_END=660 /DNA_ORIENTATION=+
MSNEIFPGNVFQKPQIPEVPCVPARFVPWDIITRNATMRNLLDDSLGYNYTEWDNPGDIPISEVEKRSWDVLDSYELYAAGSIGFDEASWDHHVNHYEAYDWDELVDEDVQGCFVKLGWDEAKWNGTAPIPNSETKDWAQLSRKQINGAKCIGYFQDLWDGVPLGLNFTVPGSFLCSDIGVVLSLFHI